MSENDEIFEKYLPEKKSLKESLKEPRFWLMSFAILVGIVLMVYFYKSVILDRMTKEDVRNSLEVVWVKTQWVEKETTPYEIKIVPSIAFKVKNVGTKPLQYVRFGGVFEFTASGEVQNDGAAMAFKEPFQPGETSEEILIKSPFGYSGASKAAFISNKTNWKKMRVKLFASTKGSGPTRIGELFPIEQKIAGYTGETGKEDLPGGEPSKSFEKIGKSIQIVGQDSIWVDRIKSKNKSIIVPSINFQIKNIGTETLKELIFKGEFFFEGNEEKLGDGIVANLKKPIKPGEKSKDITIKSELGYEATSKAAFVRNTKNWRRVKVKLFVKQVGYEYVLLGTFSIRQEIEGVKVIYKFK